MQAPPLSHHEILQLAEPFARAGRQVDLAKTDRAARSLAFKPLAHTGRTPDEPALQETLVLESYGTGTCRLTRRSTRPDGLQATLQTLGTDPAALLARLGSLAPQQQFRQGPGFVMALSYEFDSAPGPGRGGQPTSPWVLSQGVLRAGLVVLTLNLPAVRSAGADIRLESADGQRLDLPEDLLAVQGWDWARLVPQWGPAAGTWKSRLRLRGRGARRTRTAEAALDQAALHLSTVLSQPPAAYHQRCRWARYGVVLRRGIPSLTAVGLLGGAMMLPRMELGVVPKMWVLLHYLPIGLLALSFGLQELPKFEIPPWPRRSRAADWRLGGSVAAGAEAGANAGSVAGG